MEKYPKRGNQTNRKAIEKIAVRRNTVDANEFKDLLM
jgi:hypothetical protein